ncbi:MAG: hypothetical protein Q9M28_03140 [Mariprofundaceae bacterium]|nr:hypothetical protein [Mariprofundaceae bacterium]
MTQNKIKEILDMLNSLNEYFLSLPDDMLLDIDPRDNESLEQGFRFIKGFNTNLLQFNESSIKIEEQIKQYFSINPEEDDVEKEDSNESRNSRITKELDKKTPHTLDESFTYKRPYGFVLGNAAYKGLKTWKNLYIQILKELELRNRSLFLQLADENKFISNRGNPTFSRKPSELRSAQKISHSFYIEVNLSANQIKENIIEILKHFGINHREMKVYFREDRDAQLNV